MVVRRGSSSTPWSPPSRSAKTSRCSTCSGVPDSAGSSTRSESPVTPPTAPRRTSPPWSAPASGPGIRAYVPLTGAGKARPYFSKEEFAYDPEQDLYRCPAGETLLPRTKYKARRLTVYKAKVGTCEACELKPKCTDNKTGRQVLRYFEEAYVDRVRTYRGTFPYEKALRKRRV